MRRGVAAGALAGAVGALALEATSYVDMLVRGRPASDLPADAAGKLADAVGVDLGEEDRAANRRQALGPLLGYATGVGVGMAYGAIRSRTLRLPWPVAALAAGLTAMVAGAVPMTATGLTDPRQWGVAGWLADIVPHVAYGVSTALTYEALAGSPG